LEIEYAGSNRGDGIMFVEFMFSRPFNAVCRVLRPFFLSVKIILLFYPGKPVAA